MSTVVISCQHCSRKISIPAAKLPKQVSSLSCPGCKGKIVVDPAEVRLQNSPPEPATETPATNVDSRSGGAGSIGSEPPPEATLPSGVIIGSNPSVIQKIRKVVKPYGCELDVLPDAESVRESVQGNVPPLIFCVADKIGSPPAEMIAPITTMAPAERRRTVVVLIAENLATLNAGIAFLYLVNVTVATKDIERIPAIAHSALGFHNRLYQSFFSALDAAHLVG